MRRFWDYGIKKLDRPIQHVNVKHMQTNNLLDIQSIRAEFPILQQKMHGQPLVYLDNANTTQKPQQVLTAMNEFYSKTNSNIHRSVYSLSEKATGLYESTRKKIQALINAQHWQEIIFVKNTTEGINLVANCFGRKCINSGDEIIITTMEHHSNIVPWQLMAEQYGATLKVIPINDAGELDLNTFESLLSAKTRLLALTHVSNVLGTINPVKKIIERAHAQNIPVLLDGAQAIAHQAVDVQDLDCDFYVFSGHKMYGPTGIGVLYGKTQWLDRLPPYQGGGSMIQEVSFTRSTYQEIPYKFEAGTQNIAAVIGLGAAVDFMQDLTISSLEAHEHTLANYTEKALKSIPGLRLIGTAAQKSAVFSFVLDNIHPHDVGTALSTHGVAVRVGHHCAMPLMERYQLSATIRASLGIYNTEQEIDKLIDALLQVKRLFN